MTEYVVIAVISMMLSFIASMLGLGGAVLLIPAYLYLPQHLGAEPLGIKTVSGMTSVQVLATSLLSVILHHRRGAVNRRIVLWMGLPIVLSSFLGAIYSRDANPQLIIIVFSLMAFVGSALVMLKREDLPDYSPETDFQPFTAGTIALCVGFFAGLAGAPGAFILSPIMMTVLRVPTRLTIGSTLGIVLMASASTSAGKFLAGQVHPDLAAAAILGAIPGSFAGSALSHRLDVRTLRSILAVIIALVGITMLLQSLGVFPRS
ncbi:MAG TPA: sulfite exporter TauE/SafE family protein [Bacteroidota bacterium]|nr:sulfite exporter TauE/SafE family protein [Bacteroidota bacterium]